MTRSEPAGIPWRLEDRQETTSVSAACPKVVNCLTYGVDTVWHAAQL